MINKLFIWLAVLGIMLALAGGGWLFHVRSRQAEAAGGPEQEATFGRFDQVSRTLKGEKLLPAFQLCVEGVDLELPLAEPFQQSGNSCARAIFANYDLVAEGRTCKNSGKALPGPGRG